MSGAIYAIDDILLLLLLQQPSPLRALIRATCADARESSVALAVVVAVASYVYSRAPNNYAMSSKHCPVALALAIVANCFLVLLPRSRCFGRGVCVAASR